MNVSRRFFSILFGSVIAAAFLGPGTITTAARAGAEHGLSLLWTLLFATIACGVLQEASARLTVVSGRSLGEALRDRFPGAGAWLAVTAIVLGCAAYEAGNVLGGVAGAGLAVPISSRILTLLSVLAAGALLGFGSTRMVVGVLGALVAVMGGAFLATAISISPPLGELFTGLLVPSSPRGSGLLVLGLIGTTVVPYNLFLGSGIARGQSLGELRFGLAIAIGLGGLISMAVLVVGTAVVETFSYEALAAALTARLGDRAELLFAGGLFAAGFSSAVTAPLAAAVTARSIFSRGTEDPRWNEGSLRYRGVWLGVLAAGAAFGFTGVRPIPAIIAAQALNGLLLPAVAVFLLLAVNDRRLVRGALNGGFSNGMMAVSVAVTIFLGLRGVNRAAGAAFGIALPDEMVPWAGAIILAALAWPVAHAMRRGRSIR